MYAARIAGKARSSVSSTGWSASGATAAQMPEAARSAAVIQRPSRNATSSLAPRACGRRRPWATPANASAAPYVHTKVAPVEKSPAYEIARPTTAVTVPAIHATASCPGKRAACRSPIAAGMMRNANTSSTPASATELVTTMPKAA